MDCSTQGFPVYHQLLEFTQTHVQWVGDAIQPSHPLSSPSPPTFYLSQYQGLLKWVSSSHQVAKILEFIFNISPSNEYPGPISFRMDWLDHPQVPSLSSLRTELYDPKAFIAHAALLHQAFAIVQYSPLLPPVGVWTVSQFQCGRSPSQVGYWSSPWWAVTSPTS